MPASMFIKLSLSAPHFGHAFACATFDILILEHREGVDVDLDLGAGRDPVFLSEDLSAEVIEFLGRVAFDQHVVTEFIAQLKQRRRRWAQNHKVIGVGFKLLLQSLGALD